MDSLKSDLRLTRDHLVSTRAALTRLIESGEDPDSLRFQMTEALAVHLQRGIEAVEQGAFTHNGVEYLQMAGRA